MSVPPQIVPSSTGLLNGDSPAVGHISLFRFAAEGDPESDCQVSWEDGERVFAKGGVWARTAAGVP